MLIIFEFLRSHQLDVMLFFAATCLITGFLTLITKNLPKVRKTAIVLLEFNAALIMISSRFYYINKDKTGEYIWLLVRVAKFLDYFFSFSINFVMNIYLKDLYRDFCKQGNDGRKRNRIVLFSIDFIILALIIVLIITQFIPLCYTFDSQNIYHRTKGALIFLTFLPIVGFLEIFFILSNYKKLSPGVRFPLFLFLVIPFVATVLQFTTNGIAFTAMSVSGACIMLYVFIVQDMNKEIAAKTERIVNLHDKLIMGMATMVESRDNSTGGHIRRTSEVIRILCEEIMKDNTLQLSEDFCQKLIKSAPLHDLGKIAISDEILRKPGKFTPEEFEQMKEHAEEGARVVHEILIDSDDKEYNRIAENVAHYHHERIDGSGYPDGLKGDDIPLEARIMAIADVYDALVSKRVYKEAYSFEKANQIILDGMGTQFDSRLKKYYVSARPKLEAYYRKG